MARVATTFLNLGKWLDGENPGSGPQDGTVGDGLNGDKNKIDLAVGTGHNPDGSHKAAVIDAANLAATTVDGSTLEQDSGSKKLKIKDAGVTIAKLAADAVALIAGKTTDLNTHKTSADHDTHNDARYAPISLASISKHAAVTVSFTETNRSTKYFGLPAGSIKQIIITTVAGVSSVSTPTSPVGVSSGQPVIMTGDGQGIVLMKNPAGTAVIGASYDDDSGDPATAVIVMSLT